MKILIVITVYLLLLVVCSWSYYVLSLFACNVQVVSAVLSLSSPFGVIFKNSLWHPWRSILQWRFSERRGLMYKKKIFLKHACINSNLLVKTASMTREDTKDTNKVCNNDCFVHIFSGDLFVKKLDRLIILVVLGKKSASSLYHSSSLRRRCMYKQKERFITSSSLRRRLYSTLLEKSLLLLNPTITSNRNRKVQV